MKLYVHKHPASDTLANCLEVEDDAPAPPAPLEEMTVAAFTAWRDAELAAGWAPPARPVPVPESVSPRQMRRALNAAGLRDTVESAVAAAGRDMQDDWEFALEIRRDHALLNAMAAQLGMTPEQVDDLFRAASQIP